MNVNSKDYLKYMTITKLADTELAKYAKGEIKKQDVSVEYMTKEEVLDIIRKLEKRIEQLEKLVCSQDEFDKKEKCVEKNEEAHVENEPKVTEAICLFKRARQYETIDAIESIKCYKKAAALGHQKAIMKCITNGWSYK